MTERPIIMQGDSVRAILEGRKTQTRRVITHRHGIHFLGGVGEENDPSCWGWSFDGPDHSGYMVLARGLNERHDRGCVSMPCPYGEKGDRLWIKETWGMSYVDLARNRPHVIGGHWGSPARPNRKCAVVFKADDASMPVDVGETARWRSPLFMPRWASRITLEVVDVRVQRVQDISEDDARAEGCRDFFEEFPRIGRDQRLTCGTLASGSPIRASFAALWDSINAKRAPWTTNPWVWAISFEVSTCLRGAL